MQSALPTDMSQVSLGVHTQFDGVHPADGLRPAPKFGIVGEMAMCYLIIHIWKIVSKLKDKKAIIRGDHDSVYYWQKWVHKLPYPLPYFIQWHFLMFTMLVVYMLQVLWKTFEYSFTYDEDKERILDDYPYATASCFTGAIFMLFAVFHARRGVVNFVGLRAYGRVNADGTFEECEGLRRKDLSGWVDCLKPPKKTGETNKVKVGDHVRYNARSHEQWYIAEVKEIVDQVQITLKIIHTVPTKEKEAIHIEGVEKVVPWDQLAVRVYRYVESEKYVCSKERLNLDWATTEKEDILLCIISMPALFILMSCQSTLRAWELIQCADLDEKETCVEYGMGREGHKVVEIKALYQENFDFAVLCQYYVVFLFTRLCWKFIRRTVTPENMVKQVDSEKVKKILAKKFGKKVPPEKKDDYDKAYEAEEKLQIDKLISKQKKNLKLTTFQGVHWWCAIGLITLTLNFAYQFWYAHYGVWETNSQLKDVYDQAASKLKDWFTPFTFLCIYNMVWVCNSPVINASIKGANSKFLGTRLLILFTQFQATFINGLLKVCDGGEMTLINSHLPSGYEDLKAHLNDFCQMKEAEQMMLQSSLLTWEACAIVLFNYLSWRGVDYPETFLDTDDNIASHVEEELTDRELDSLVESVKEVFKPSQDSSDKLREFREGFRNDRPLLEALLRRNVASTKTQGGEGLYEPLVSGDFASR